MEKLEIMLYLILFFALYCIAYVIGDFISFLFRVLNICIGNCGG